MSSLPFFFPIFTFQQSFSGNEILYRHSNLAQIQEVQDLGILDGVTTNPLMAKEGIKGDINIKQHYIDICNIVAEMLVLIIATDFEGI